MDFFSPFRIRGLELRNRFMRSATHDGTADQRAMVTDATVALYRPLARGGLGLIVTGGAPVTAEAQGITPIECFIHSDETVPGFRRIVDTVHAGGAKVAIQLGHAGIKSYYHRLRGTAAPAPSQVEGFPLPHRAMTEEDIRGIVAAFGDAAVRAREAGMDAVQLHGGHGFLMCQFLSPLFNRRTDRWGGSLENRCRFHVEVIKEVRRRLGNDYPILMKFAPRDEVDGGVTLEDGVEAARHMVAAGLDAIEITRGVEPGDLAGAARNTTKPRPPASAAAEEKARADNPRFRERALAIKKAVSVPVMEVGGVRGLAMAQSIVDSGEADIISLCRPLIREPGLVARWQRGDRAQARCISCNGCFWMMDHEGGVACYWERHPEEARSA